MRYFFIFSILLAFTNIQAQEAPPEIIDQWFLYEVTVDDLSYLPEDYDIFPDVLLQDDGSEGIRLYITTPTSVGCAINTSFPITADNFFELGPDMVCLTLPECSDWPVGPCTVMHGAHADFYLNYFDESFDFTITENPDDTKSLQVTNANGDVAIYNSAPLMDVSKFENSSVSIYPNPTRDIIHIKSSTAQVEKIVVYSLTGQIVGTFNGSKEIDVSNLDTGFYLLKFLSEGKSFTYKIIKQ